MWARAWSITKLAWGTYRLYTLIVWLVGWLVTSGLLLAFVERLRTAPTVAKIFLALGCALVVLMAAPFIAALYSRLLARLGPECPVSLLPDGSPGDDLAIECEPKIVGKRVYLAITNRDVPQEFIGQVVGIEGADPELPDYWFIRWQGTTLSRSQILTGATVLLELVELDAMGTFSPAGGRPGRFWFLCPEDARQEVWLGMGDMAEARRLGVNFIYHNELTVTVRIASVQTSRTRAVTLTLGIKHPLDPIVEMRPSPSSGKVNE